MSKKPWDDDIRVSAQVSGAGCARPAGGRLTAAQYRYAEHALEREIGELAAFPRVPSGRNDRLNISAFKLGQLVAAGALDEPAVRQRLYGACVANNLINDDGGERGVLNTIESGLGSGKREPRDLTHVGAAVNGVNGSAAYTNGSAPHTPPSAPLASIRDIENDFWLRPSLQKIYVAAMSRMCAPWGVLGYCAARALALVPPHITLPEVIGGVGSLNWFAAIAAPSGGGKGSAHAVAKTLVDEYVITRNLGSGEGLVDAYIRPADKDTGEERGLNESIMFIADEIDAMHALNSRSGNTMSTILRSGFSGETLGFSYRQASSMHLAGQSYRMTLVVNVQPARAGTLMDDPHGGTLQRFMWFPGIDERVSLNTPPMPTPLALPPFHAWQYSKTVAVPKCALDLIRLQRVSSQRGEPELDEAINGHALYIREKFAYALAVLDGRHEMSEDDWRLAGIASRVSDCTRVWVKDRLKDAATADAERRGEMMGVSYAAADEAKAAVNGARMHRIVGWLQGKIGSAGKDGISRGDLNYAIAGRDRAYLQGALDALEADGIICKTKTEGRAQTWAAV